MKIILALFFFISGDISFTLLAVVSQAFYIETWTSDSRINSINKVMNTKELVTSVSTASSQDKKEEEEGLQLKV